MALQSTLLSVLSLIIFSPQTSCQPQHVTAILPEYISINNPLDLSSPCSTPIVNCIVSPCWSTTCNAYPNAICTDNYCGGCNAIYHDQNGNQLTTQMCDVSDANASPLALPISTLPAQPKALALPSASPYCSHPLGWVYCYPAPCLVLNCLYYPNALCINNYCGQCTADFYDANHNKLTHQQCGIQTTTPYPTRIPTPSPTICPAGVNIVNCIVIPCSVSKCPSYPNAICTNNYCGACQALWHNNGIALTTQQCNNPNGLQELPNGPFCSLGWHICAPTPCSLSKCPTYPQATCYDNYCGICQAVWHINGDILTNAQCPPPTLAPTKYPTMNPTMIPTTVTLHPSHNPSIAPTPAPTNIPSLSPTPAPTSYPTPSPTPAPTPAPTTPKPTTRTLNPTPRPTLPPNYVVTPQPRPISPFCTAGWVHCYPPPCAASSCPGQPTAVCMNNYCGRCSAIWLGTNQLMFTAEQCKPHVVTSNPTAKPTPKPTAKPTANPSASPITQKPTTNPTILVITSKPTQKVTVNPTTSPVIPPTTITITDPPSTPVVITTQSSTSSTSIPTGNPIIAQIHTEPPVVCIQATETCTDTDICCGGGVSQCYLGTCCIKHRKRGCFKDSDCCYVDGVALICSNEKCKLDRSALIAAAARNVESKFDNFHVTKDTGGNSNGNGNKHMAVSISTLAILFIFILLIIPMSFYLYYRKSVERKVFHELENNVHSDDELYVD